MTSAEQTAKLEQLRDRLQSIAIMAVEIQDSLGNPDRVADTLNDIEADLAVAIKINNLLSE